MNDLEKKYTSTTNKLLAHPELLEDIKKWIFRPLSLQLAPTDKCNLRCNMCSVDNRNWDELSIEQVVAALYEFRLLWAKTVEITWGWDPTMYRKINELIENAIVMWYEVWMITNWILVTKTIKQENLDLLTRLRISLNSLDYVKDIDVPTINWTLWFSYVRTEKSDLKKLDKITYYAEKYWADFLRVVPDCLDVATKENYIKEIWPLIEKYPKLFFQQKEHRVPSNCWIGYIKPFINSDWLVYMCSANPLIGRKFNPERSIWTINDIPWIYKRWDIWFKTDKCQEWKCFFKEQNDLIKEVKDWLFIPPTDLQIPHKKFI